MNRRELLDIAAVASTSLLAAPAVEAAEETSSSDDDPDTVKIDVVLRDPSSSEL